MSWSEQKPEKEGLKREVRDRKLAHAASPFRVSEERPPSFFDGRFWGVMRWGRKAGRWGMGITVYEMS